MESGESASTLFSNSDEWGSFFTLSSSPSRSPSRTISMTPQPMNDRRRSFFTPNVVHPQTHLRREPGFDYRRPAMTTTSQQNTAPQVIDLTEDAEDADDSASSGSEPVRPPVSGRGAQRLPRYDREIIDLSEDTPVARRNTTRNTTTETQSPDVQFVGERRLPNPNPTPPRARTPEIRTRHPPSRHLRPPEPEPDVLFVGEQRHELPPGYRRLQVHAQGGQRVVFGPREEQHILRGVGTAIRNNPHFFGFAAPARVLAEQFEGLQFDFETAGFDLGLDRDNTPPPAQIQAPDPAPKGFTRTPVEDEVLVCPNCDDELGVGSTEQKKQIWIVRKCGHVYCGECTHARALSKRKREKMPAETAKGQPFSKCVVDGCGEKTNGRAQMLQLYL